MKLKEFVNKEKFKNNFILGAEDKIMDDYKLKGEDVTALHQLVQASGKMVLIHKLLPKLQQGGHKVCLTISNFDLM